MKLKILISALMVFSATTLFAQSGFAEDLQAVKEAITITSITASYLVVVIAILILTQLAKKKLNKTSSTPNWAVRVLACNIGAIVSIIGSKIELLILPWASFFGALIFGVLAAITSNGLYDTKIVSFVLSIFKKKSVD